MKQTTAFLFLYIFFNCIFFCKAMAFSQAEFDEPIINSSQVAESKPGPNTLNEQPKSEEQLQPQAEPQIEIAQEPAIKQKKVKATYKVWIWQESGDCLWNIAKKYYGDPWLWKDIYEANRDQIEDPQVIFPKQVLVIPEIEDSEEK
jgi:nucleoid-associated protein YgaU